MLTAMLFAAIMSTYIINYNDRIARFIVSCLGQKLNPDRSSAGEAGLTSRTKRDIVVLGCFREGRFFLDSVENIAPELKERILVVDFNQSLRGMLSDKGYAWKYGDLSNPETLAHIGVGNASIVICTIADVFLKGTSNLRLLRQMKQLAPNAKKIMLAEDHAAAGLLLGEGADRVIIAGESPGKAIFENLQSLI
jgi:voltage-gated potassium channel Kch